MKTPVVMCWSGGKDSALALGKLLTSQDYEVRGLLTTVTEGYERISMHGVRRELLHAQAESIGIPLTEVLIPPQCINDTYQERMKSACLAFKAQGIMHMAFGDLFLEDIRAYRDGMLGIVAMKSVYPLWGLDTAALARGFITDGYQAILCCVDPTQLEPKFCGSAFNQSLLDSLPERIDACGENGEFHTFVTHAPYFRQPIACTKGEVVLRDNFWFCDILSVMQ